MPNTVLTVGVGRPLVLPDNNRVVPLQSSDAVLDWLWERGREVDSVVLSHGLAAPELIEVVRRDWPEIRLSLA